MDTLNDEITLLNLKVNHNVDKIELLVKTQVLKAMREFVPIFIKYIDSIPEYDWFWESNFKIKPTEPFTDDDIIGIFESVRDILTEKPDQTPKGQLTEVYAIITNYIWILNLLESLPEPHLWSYSHDKFGPDVKKFVKEGKMFYWLERSPKELKEKLKNYESEIKAIEEKIKEEE